MPKPQQPAKPEMRVLIVEDDLALEPIWNIILRRALKGVSLDWAISSEEARKMIRAAKESKKPYGLIVTDIFLSGEETGLDLLSSAEMEKTRAKVILVSATEEAKIKEHFAEADKVETVLPKPLDVGECARAIGALFAAEGPRRGPTTKAV